jgi:hypothetical protein
MSCIHDDETAWMCVFHDDLSMLKAAMMVIYGCLCTDDDQCRFFVSTWIKTRRGGARELRSVDACKINRIHDEVETGAGSDGIPEQSFCTFLS